LPDFETDLESLSSSSLHFRFSSFSTEHWIYAHKNEKIEGVALCGNDGRYGYIHHLAVSKLTRNKGVGRSLVEACIRFLQKRHIIIMVRENNKAGNEFWNRLRFQEVDGLKIQYLKTSS
jgi:ribosomal protein S18 acetylase RimI-like enzyme